MVLSTTDDRAGEVVRADVAVGSFCSVDICRLVGEDEVEHRSIWPACLIREKLTHRTIRRYSGKKVSGAPSSTARLVKVKIAGHQHHPAAVDLHVL